MEQYVKCINLMTVSRDYTDADLLQLELHCDETFRRLVAHCGGKSAVTNYIGSNHVVWMCNLYGNIWRYRNEGVEAFNKTLSKRCNMFNSAGNKERLVSSGKVKPFEVLGKWSLPTIYSLVKVACLERQKYVGTPHRHHLSPTKIL